jgi:uncharacterized protein YigE (DUF2233 family)
VVKPAWFFAVAVLLPGSVQADWTVAATEKERGGGGRVERRHIVLTENGDEAMVDLALFQTKSATLRVIDNPTGQLDLAAAMRREHGLAGVNGGYFDPADKPVGLVISDGRMIAPLRKARLLSGIAVVSEGRIQLLRVAEYSPKQKAIAALQCGPFLVDHFIAMAGSDRALIGFCSPVTLAQLAKILTGLAPDLKVQRALNLDGGSSSAFWFAGDGENFSIPEQKTVRNFVAVVPK